MRRRETEKTKETGRAAEGGGGRREREEGGETIAWPAVTFFYLII